MRLVLRFQRYSNYHFVVISVISKIRVIKNVVQREFDGHKIIIQLEIGPEIALFSKLKYYKCIALVKFSVWCTIFAELSFHTYIMRICDIDKRALHFSAK